jgi:hypothetical protein
MLPNRHNRPMAHVRQLRDSLPEGPKEGRKEVLYGGFVWARMALNRWFPARTDATAGHEGHRGSPVALSSSPFSVLAFSFSLLLSPSCSLCLFLVLCQGGSFHSRTRTLQDKELVASRTRWPSSSKCSTRTTLVRRVPTFRIADVEALSVTRLVPCPQVGSMWTSSSWQCGTSSKRPSLGSHDTLATVIQSCALKFVLTTDSTALTLQ